MHIIQGFKSCCLIVENDDTTQEGAEQIVKWCSGGSSIPLRRLRVNRHQFKSDKRWFISRCRVFLVFLYLTFNEPSSE